MENRDQPNLGSPESKMGRRDQKATDEREARKREWCTIPDSSTKSLIPPPIVNGTNTVSETF